MITPQPPICAGEITTTVLMTFSDTFPELSDSETGIIIEGATKISSATVTASVPTLPESSIKFMKKVTGHTGASAGTRQVTVPDQSPWSD